MQAPSLVMPSGTSRQQVPLRDYLNTRVAPFLKKAITESLGVEAEYPLQWLGECLINQSILYEGNPDPTNIKERFRYTFEAPKPAHPPAQEAAEEPPTNGVPDAATAHSEDMVVNGEKGTEGTEEEQPQVVPVEQPTGVEPTEAPAAAGQDTEMGGTA